MTGFADHAGYGTDPAGDAARREAMSRATVTPEMVARLIHAGEARPEAAPGPADTPPVPDHALTYQPGKAGTQVTCECGRWDGWFNGARSRRRVLDDHACHVAKELAAVAPLKVVAVRADQEEPPP